MHEFLLVGWAIGLGVGLFHAATLIQRQAARGLLPALYNALWSLILWTVFGPYVLAVWLIGGIVQLVAGKKRTAGAASQGT